MREELFYQRKQMKEAIRWINVIEECDENILADHYTSYFKGVREEAVSGYALAMTVLVQHSIEITKVEL